MLRVLCEPGGIQTHDHLLRRQELYSAELPARHSASKSSPLAQTAANLEKNHQEAKQFYSPSGNAP